EPLRYAHFNPLKVVYYSRFLQINTICSCLTLIIQVYGDIIENLKNYNKILESINTEPTGNQNVK
ncbi:hypothetical protein, partial [Paenimyroides tangerinum]|uniref:hypothetical protein n=1 Tax=Paenimyroides tangerinum TaxID=2488728 RepID=UPI00193934DB